MIAQKLEQSNLTVALARLMLFDEFIVVHGSVQSIIASVARTVEALFVSNLEQRKKILKC
jgi:hypothetical protein